MRSTFIMGSCVARDTFARLPGSFSLSGYVARQSLISTGHPVADDTVPFAELDSPFQARMLAGDLAGDAIKRLASAPAIDLLLWDLTDERLGVHPAPGGWFTRAIEGIGAGFYDPALPTVAFGSDRHFALWSAALEVWLGALRSRGLAERTLLLQVPWAERTVEGEETPVSFGMSAGAANAATFRYQRAIMDAGDIEMIRPRVPVVARRGHRWGFAPFHYTEEVYDDLCDQIVAFAERQERT